MTTSYLLTEHNMLSTCSSGIAYSDPRYIGPIGSLSPFSRRIVIGKTMTNTIFRTARKNEQESQYGNMTYTAIPIWHPLPLVKYQIH